MLPFGGFPIPAQAGTAAGRSLPQDVPLGDPRIYPCLRVPGAYRSLPRPSSAPKPRHPPAGVPLSGPRRTLSCRAPPPPMLRSQR